MSRVFCQSSNFGCLSIEATGFPNIPQGKFSLRINNSSVKKLIYGLYGATRTTFPFTMIYFFFYRQINFFASKPSPTEAILDLWEARTLIEEAPVTELTNILRAMGRQDAAVILERELGNAWV